MPEANSALLYAYTPEPLKKSPIIKLSGGIGDTDGYPAFDVESDAYATKDDSKWGFLITGGAEFHMPLTVFQVTPDGLADKGGIRLGDIILEINEEDSTQLTLTQAHEKIDASGKKIFFLVKSMDYEDNLDGYEPGEEKTIVLRVPKPMPPPKVASIEARLLEMQRKLSEIAEIPKILSSTLATVSQTFEKIMPGHACEPQQQYRKYSYDEDAIDYELSDGDDEEDDDDNDVNVESESDLHQKKDATPESDYSSEANDVDDELAAGEDDTDADEEGEEENHDFYYATNATKVVADNEDDDDEEDFLSTTYTWNLRNMPKLLLNNVAQDVDNNDSDDEEIVDLNGQNEKMQRQEEDQKSKLVAPGVLLQQEKQEKVDRLERSWPWADREKIIYKQSTCHLVSRKPQGLIGQRIQLLAKQNLLENLQKFDKPK